MWTYVHANLQNTAEIANTDILAANITPHHPPSILRVMIAIDSAEVFNANITRGGVSRVVGFNSNVALVAEALYAFEILISTGDTINFQTEGNTNVMVMKVQEILGE